MNPYSRYSDDGLNEDLEFWKEERKTSRYLGRSTQKEDEEIRLICAEQLQRQLARLPGREGSEGK